MTKLSRKTKLLLLIGGLLLLFMGTVFILSGRGNEVDVLPEEGTAADYSEQARVINGSYLFTALGGGVRFDSFSKDLYVFGKNNYNSYKDSGGVIGFTIDSEIKKEGETLVFSGKYGSSKNLIRITLKPLKNYRLNTSITDTKTSKNLDSQLPSNSLRNQFISTLPVSKEAYAVDYVDSDDSFVITIYDGDEETKAIAEQYLIASLKVTDLSNENYDVVVTRSASEGGSPSF